MVTSDQGLDEHDLEIAAAIQRALLPAACPQCPHGRISAGHRMLAAVGGDFYDFRQAGPDNIGVLIGDVMGHGVSAALLMAMIVGLLRRDPEAAADPVAAARLINYHLVEIGDSVGHVLICSLFYGVLDVHERTLEFVNAGHPAPIVCNKQTCLISSLVATCPVLGAVESDDIQSDGHTFSNEDRITLYSDGVTDVQNARDQRFGHERLHMVASDNISLSARELIDRIFEELDRFAEGRPMTDDQSIVVVDFGHAPRPKRS